ncbi:HelD family protein [Brevibacillus brevis]|uniref:HelD family protein n=1 Tax=Brevibacillus brevis TaxID=1393 RepID=UPI000D0F218C|nr:UvrD-helicase domain-containing protein [Brevibacillus brevis]PSJ66887.1 RNA helicase [Brevibacillus brevis]RED36027.1 Rep family ATP-dependent DNA helicase [Brevibacillus brevis]GEC88514.1 DNA helicase [Brevibacillus brevis]VEF88863.1 Helicase IV [Brevibacillus brevis]
MSTQHRDYELEQKKLDETISAIDEEMEQLRNDIREATDDYVKQVVNYKKAKDLRYLEDQGREKPYFGRVDFLKDEIYELDQVYIGKRGIVRSDTFDSVVVDWRAPIAGLYYSGESKDAFYRMGREIVRGEVRLKRNFAIEDGKIVGIYDGAVKETINREMGHPDEFLQEGFIDEFLAANLNQANDSRLKDIVATIQSEQNDIIRAEKERPIVVQGVAGSGKTTIALHRLSYLIYNYQDSMMSKKFMVFAPNRMFLTYISEVLPELGVDDVQQSTFVDWAARLVKPLLPKGWRIVSPDKPLQLFFEEGQDERQQEMTRNRLRFKGSLACREALEQYIRHIVETRIPFKKLSFLYNKTKQVFSIPGDFIRQCFLEQFANMPYHRRVEALRKHLKQEMNKQLFAHLRERKVDLDKEGLYKFEKMLEQILDTYLTSFPRLEIFAAYRELIADEELLRKLVPADISDEVVRDVTQSSAALFAEERLEPEDIAPLLYLQHIVEGMNKAEHFDHTVVDEAQDLSALEIAVIALATKRNSLTIVGDIAQGIHSYRGIHAWEELTKGIFAHLFPSYYTLSQSYRSTIEIMRCANEVLRQIELPETVLAKPVLRHGEKPIMVKARSRVQLWEDISSRVAAYQSEGFKTIAIVAKTIQASKKAHKGLQDKVADLTLLGSKDNQFPGGVTVMPAFLTKGLQFDVVILLDIDAYQNNEWDAKLLYVAMTRPVHRLVLTQVDGVSSPLLKDLPIELYTMATDE